MTCDHPASPFGALPVGAHGPKDRRGVLEPRSGGVGETLEGDDRVFPPRSRALTVSIVEFRLLGPIEVVEDGRARSIGGPKQRTVLAHLVLRANNVLAQDRLIEEVWGEDPPPAARSTLRGYLSHLRTAVGPERLERRSGGYALRADPSAVRSDAERPKGRRG